MRAFSPASSPTSLQISSLDENSATATALSRHQETDMSCQQLRAWTDFYPNTQFSRKSQVYNGGELASAWVLTWSGGTAGTRPERARRCRTAAA